MTDNKKIDWKKLQHVINDRDTGLCGMLDVDIELMDDEFVEFAISEDKSDKDAPNEALICAWFGKTFLELNERGAELINWITNLTANSISNCDNVQERIKMTTHFLSHMCSRFGESFGNKSIYEFAHMANIIDRDRHKFLLEWEDESDKENRTGTMTIKDKGSGKIICHALFGSYKHNSKYSSALSQALADGFTGGGGDA